MFIVFPGTNYGDQIFGIEDADPLQAKCGYEKIGGQLANIGCRNDGLGVSFRFVNLHEDFLLTAMRTFPLRSPSDEVKNRWFMGLIKLSDHVNNTPRPILSKRQRPGRSIMNCRPLRISFANCVGEKDRKRHFGW